MSARHEGRRFSAGRDHHRMASAFLAWLASHRDRLTVWHVGGRRLVLMVVWDSRGSEVVDRSNMEVAAVRLIVNGPRVYGQTCPICKATSAPVAEPDGSNVDGDHHRESRDEGAGAEALHIKNNPPLRVTPVSPSPSEDGEADDRG